MNTHNLLRHATHVVFLLSLLLIAGGTGRAARAAEPPVEPPVLQRVMLSGDATFFFAFHVSRGAAHPNLVELRPGATQRDVTTKTYIGPLLLGGLRCHSPTHPFRWSLGSRALFATNEGMQIVHQPTAPWLYRFPLAALVEKPDPPGNAHSDSCIDRSKIPDDLKPTSTMLDMTYAGFEPIKFALLGLRRGWSEATHSVANPAKIVHYDFRTPDDVQLELFITTDGAFFKWFFDGKSWKQMRYYKFPVEGEFLIFHQGASLVLEQNGRWCIFESLDLVKPVIRPLVDRVKGKPLILIEDKTAGTAFFLHDDLLYNENGTRVFQVDTNADETTQLTSAATFVRSKRAK